MPEDLPIKIAVPSRSELVNRYKQLRRIRNPLIDTSEGTEVDVDAKVQADAVTSIVGTAPAISSNAVVSSARGTAIKQWGEVEGVDEGNATGSSGFVQIRASSGGGRIFRGDVLVQKSNPGGPRFQCSLEDQYQDLAYVPIVAIDSGRETNLKSGTVMVWTPPRAGIAPDCTVAARPDGSGLTGGNDAPTGEDHKKAILRKKRNPPGGGNDAHYQDAVRQTPGVPVQAAFTYPAILGPGNKSIAFTVTPTRTGGSRLPTSQQASLVRSHVESTFGADDSALVSLLAETGVTPLYKIRWASKGWVDYAPFPLYAEQFNGIVTVDSVTDALNFTLKLDTFYGSTPEPAAGQTIAFWDNGSVTKKTGWRKKRILSVSGSGPWTIVCDTTNGASDESYTPLVDQRVSPWAESMDTLVTPIIQLFERLGPGEQTVNLPDDGFRKRRSPQAPSEWPHTLTQAMLESVADPDKNPQILDRQVIEGFGIPPSIGTPGVLSYMLSLYDLAVYPL